MQSHSEVLGDGAFTYEFGWGRDTFLYSVAPVMYQALVIEQQQIKVLFFMKLIFY